MYVCVRLCVCAKVLGMLHWLHQHMDIRISGRSLCLIQPERWTWRCNLCVPVLHSSVAVQDPGLTLDLSEVIQNACLQQRLGLHVGSQSQFSFAGKLTVGVLGYVQMSQALMIVTFAGK